MTERLLDLMKQELGTGTGPSRYRQLKELAPFLGVPLGVGKRGGATITEETITALAGLTPAQWEKGVGEYGDEYRQKQLVILSPGGVAQIRNVLGELD